MSEVGLRAKLTAEFVGTFLLVFTVACNSLGGTHPAFAALSIGGVLGAVVYALGGVSGAHVNPAVTFAVALIKQVEVVTAAYYIVTQILAGLIAAALGVALFGHSVNLQPGEGYSQGAVAGVEILYTGLLAFVVLNTACCKKDAGNQYFGIAIGGSVVCGAFAAGSISGGAYNPAIALGIDLSSVSKGFGYSLAYSLYQLIGAGLAAGVYRLCRPEEFGGEKNGFEQLISEFVGSLVLTTTVGLAIHTGTPSAVLAIASCLGVLIYALGSVSGGHLNPAVTLSILLSGRKQIEPSEAAGYMGVQLVGGLVGAMIATGITATSHGLAPTGTLAQAFVAELIFTAVLAFTVLTTATTRTKNKDIFGLAIGSTVVIGGLAAGGLSGGSLNPAVSIGLDLSKALFVPESRVANALAYTVAELLGGSIAAAVFSQTHAEEYTKQPLKA